MRPVWPVRLWPLVRHGCLYTRHTEINPPVGSRGDYAARDRAVSTTCRARSPDLLREFDAVGMEAHGAPGAEMAQALTGLLPLAEAPGAYKMFQKKEDGGDQGRPQSLSPNRNL